CSRDRIPLFINFGNGYSFNSVFAMNLDDCGLKVQRNVEVFETLNNVPSKASGVRQNLDYSFNLSALEGETTGHDQTNVTRTKNNSLLTRHISFNVHIPLSGTS